MGQNRTTTKSNVITKNVPTVTNAILTDILNADFADNLRFRLDVAVAQSSSVTNITCDFADKDRIDLTRTGGALNITLSGLEDGDVKYLLITKTAGQAITFVGATDVTPLIANVTAVSSVLYEIVRKASNYYVRAFLETVLAASGAETIAGTITNKFVTPDGLQDKAASSAETIAGTSTTKFVTPDALTDKKATTGLLGLVLPAFSPYTENGSSTDPGGNPLYINPPELERMFQLRLGGLAKKLINIGNWNMDSTDNVDVVHGLTFTDIRRVSAFITSDIGTVWYEFLDEIRIYASEIKLVRAASGIFDNTNFDDGSINRGYVVIDYLY